MYSTYPFHSTGLASCSSFFFFLVYFDVCPTRSRSLLLCLTPIRAVCTSLRQTAVVRREPCAVACRVSFMLHGRYVILFNLFCRTNRCKWFHQGCCAPSATLYNAVVLCHRAVCVSTMSSRHKGNMDVKLHIFSTSALALSFRFTL